MSEKLIEGFFYGLYMDPDLLRGINVNPVDPRPAYLANRQIDFKGLVKVITKPDQKVWGMLIKLTKSDIEAMYSVEAAKVYSSESVLAILDDGHSIQATCYNLPINEQAELNRDYINKLLPILKKLSLPAPYIQEVEGLLE